MTTVLCVYKDICCGISVDLFFKSFKTVSTSQLKFLTVSFLSLNIVGVVV